MITIGLLGGIASGKSTVARLLAEHGAVVLDADRAAHEVLNSPDVLASLAEQWGDAVVGDDGLANREVISERVFGDSDEATANRRLLEAQIHPGVRARLRTELAALREQTIPATVLDIPLLLEAGYHGDCNRLLFVDTPEADRRARAAERGWSSDEFAWREAAQRPISEKRAAATDLISNDGTAEALRAAVANFWRERVATPGG